MPETGGACVLDPVVECVLDPVWLVVVVLCDDAASAIAEPPSASAPSAATPASAFLAW
jgi:hypothetical protein